MLSSKTPRSDSTVIASDEGRSDKNALVESWRRTVSTTSHKNQRGNGLIAKLYLACIQCLDDLVYHGPPSDHLERSRKRVDAEDSANPVASNKVLKTASYQLRLWGDSYDAGGGKLDEKLGASSELRSDVLGLLQSIGGILASRTFPTQFTKDLYINTVTRAALTHLVSTPTESTPATILQTNLDEARFVTGHQDDFCDFDSDQESNNEDQTESRTAIKLGEALEDLLTDIDCLQELGPALEYPFQDSDDDEKCAPDIAAAATPALPFAEPIEHKFPHASPTLVGFLAERNMKTFRRLQHVRYINDKEEILWISDLSDEEDFDIFHDPDFASFSAPGECPAPTHASSTVSSVDEDSHVSYPSLPGPAKQGKSFLCIACGTRLWIQNERNWREHLRSDLQPYVCVFSGCGMFLPWIDDEQLVPFWESHLQKVHLSTISYERSQCPLCVQPVTHSDYVTHVRQHLEDIALVALPRECQLDLISINEDIQSQSTLSALTEFEIGSKKNVEDSSRQDIPSSSVSFFSRSNLNSMDNLSTHETDAALAVSNQFRTSQSGSDDHAGWNPVTGFPLNNEDHKSGLSLSRSPLPGNSKEINEARPSNNQFRCPQCAIPHGNEALLKCVLSPPPAFTL